MKLRTQILLAFSLILILSATDSYINYMLSLKIRRNTEFLSRSESVIRISSRLHKTIIEMQSAFRGFLLTDDESYLVLYYNGIREVPRLVANQRELLVNDESQLSKLEYIYLLHQKWLQYSKSLIDAKLEIIALKSGNQDYDQLFEGQLKKHVGKKLNDDITVQFNEFDRQEYKLRETRRAALMSSIKTTHQFSTLFLILTIGIGIVSTIYIITLISKRIKSMVQLAEKISKGEFSKIEDSKNDELTGLSASLNKMSDRLSKNIDELEKRNSELNQFAYVVSHDLKAPIRGIYNVIHWIEEDLGHTLSPELRKYLQIIPQRTRRMEDLINGLLDYARTREKTPDEAIDVSELVREICDIIVPRNFKVNIVNLPVLVTERLKLEQIFTNLISNSVKNIVVENGEITISCTDQGNYYEFSVRDNGIGIDPEYHDKIFEIFQTLREKNEKESTGIGLAIIKKIIDDQHCSIKVNSKAGAGAEFVFTWPKMKSAA